MKKSELKQLIREVILEETVKISSKDWDRMLELVLANDNGDKVAKLIQDKDKAIARFVAGLKLADKSLDYNNEWQHYFGSFSSLGDKAIKLGATPEEIQLIYDATTVPTEYTQKMSKLSNKELDDRFVGDISRAVLASGFDINYLPYRGFALTPAGKNAMEKNGRKWTIGYKSEIILNDKKFNFNFDAITDEGGGATFYVLSPQSDRIFNSFNPFINQRFGKHEFISKLKTILTANK